MKLRRWGLECVGMASVSPGESSTGWMPLQVWEDWDGRQEWSSECHGQEMSPGDSSMRNVHPITNIGCDLEELGLELRTDEARA